MNILSVRAGVIGLLSVFSLSAWSADAWLIASHDENINSGERMSVMVVKPDSHAGWPPALRLKLDGAGMQEELPLHPVASEGSDNGSRLYQGVVKQKFVGVVRASLLEFKSNRMLLLASHDDDIGPLPISAKPALTEDPGREGADAVTARPTAASSPTIVLANPGDEPALSANEGSYILFGSSSARDTDSRFQISFKYRPFDPASSIAEFAPYLSNVYFAYTQTSLWDLGEESGPFRDTSYRPSLFYRWTGSGRGLNPDEWRAGYEHESNGQSDDDSRSIDVAFIRPAWHLDFADGRRLSLLPRFYHYLRKSENSDIHRFRGYADWQLRYGREDGLITSVVYRQGTAGFASGQLDISYPLSDRIFARTGTFMHMQLYSGYGETLLDYNIRRSTQIRLGISLVR